jgi:competence protein ComEC
LRQSTDVLKVGHHGSQYASTAAFIAAVSPKIAIISVGRHNAFGHPGPATMATLARTGAKIYRTDKCGALSLNATAGIESSMFCP